MRPSYAISGIRDPAFCREVAAMHFQYTGSYIAFIEQIARYRKNSRPRNWIPIAAYRIGLPAVSNRAAE